MLAQWGCWHANWTVTVATLPQGRPWSKAAAVAPAIAASHADLLVIADADVWAGPLDRAARRLEGGAPWVVPHQMVHRLDEQSTAALLERGVHPSHGVTCEPPYQGVEGGGLVMLPRATYLDVPLDPRFTGWGQEDNAWAIALTYLAGEHVRLAADLWHLWHPPQPRLSRRYGSPQGRALWRAYVRARSDTHQMRALVEEAKCCSPTVC